MGLVVDGACAACNGVFPNCTACAASFCTACGGGHVVDAANNCIDATACGRVVAGRCVRCRDREFFSGDGCAACNEHCVECSSRDACVACDVGYVRHGGVCVPHDAGIPNCVVVHDGDGCVRCADGFFLTDAATCEPCDTACGECSGAGTNCTACRARSMLVRDAESDMAHCEDSASRA